MGEINGEINSSGIFDSQKQVEDIAQHIEGAQGLIDDLSRTEQDDFQAKSEALKEHQDTTMIELELSHVKEKKAELQLAINKYNEQEAQLMSLLGKSQETKN